MFVQVYEILFVLIWYFDLYCIEVEDDILELGWEDVLDIVFCFVEWLDRLGRLMFFDSFEVCLSFEEDECLVEFIGYGIWKSRLLDIVKLDLVYVLGCERWE